MANENKDNSFTELTEEEMENSTVFSKPNSSDNPKKAPKKPKILLKTIISISLAVVVILLFIFISKNFKKPVSSAGADQNVTSDIQDNMITLTKNNLEDVKAIHLQNENCTLDFYPEKSTVESEDAEHTDTLWYLKGIKKALTDTEYTGITVEDCTTLKVLSKRKWDNSYDYGFSSPTAKVDVTLKDGSYSFTVGKILKSGEMESAYLTISTDTENVYILPKDRISLFTEQEKHYISRNLPTAIKQTELNKDYFETTLQKFDTAFLKTVSGEKLNFEMFSRNNSSILYKMTSPYELPASGETVGQIVSVMQNDIEGSDVYYYNSKGIPEKIKRQFKLSSPVASLNYKVGNDKVFISFYGADDENFFSATVKGIPAIYKVAKTDVPFIEYSAYDFVSSTLIIDDITATEKFVVNDGTKDYEFNISVKPAESEDEEDQTLVKYKNKDIDFQNFSNFYEYIISISPYISKDGILSKRPSGVNKYFSVKLYPTKASGDKPTELTVYKLKSNKNRYYLELDGKPVGLCYTKYPDLIYNSINPLINGEDLQAVEE